TAATSRATTSSPAPGANRSCGSTATAAARAAGTCTAYSPDARSTMRALPAYAELHCLSNFSFLRGASSSSELVERASALGYSALALTDECSVAGVVRAHEAAKQLSLPLIVGSEVRLDDGAKLVLLATDREGYGGLSSLITSGRRRTKKGSYALGW